MPNQWQENEHMIEMEMEKVAFNMNALYNALLEEHAFTDVVATKLVAAYFQGGYKE